MRSLFLLCAGLLWCSTDASQLSPWVPQDAKRQERHKTLEKNRKREEQAEVRRQKNKKVRVEKEQTEEKKKLGRPINKDDL
jgi:hypothetical protein